MENIIRSDINTELLEILELYCELLLARAGLLESKECDAGLEEAVKSIIYAAPRTEIKELQAVRQILMEKYGKEFALVAIDNVDGKVAERVLNKLRLHPPGLELVESYLREIARTYGISWPRQTGLEDHHTDADDGDHHDDHDNDHGPKVPKGSGKERREAVDHNPEEEEVETEAGFQPRLSAQELRRATPPRDLGPRSPISIAPPSARVDNANPKLKLPLPADLRPDGRMIIGQIGNRTGEGGGAGRDDTRERDPLVGKGNGNDKNHDDNNDGNGKNQTSQARKMGGGEGEVVGDRDDHRRVGKTTTKANQNSNQVVEGKIPDVDELAKRFAALKR